MHNRFCQPVSIGLRLAATCFFVISVAACSPATPGPKPPLYAPIALTQPGSAAKFDFWAYPKDAHEKDVLAVGMRFKRDWSAPDQKIDYTYLKKIETAKIGLRLTATQNGNPVAFKSYSEFDSAVQLSPIASVGNADIKARIWAHDSDYDYFYLADLSRTDGGLYKVKVEVVEPNLDMEGMQSEVFVAYRLFGGK